MRGKQWSRVAVRRYLLYNVFLHELGHLQIVRAKAKTDRRRFASETLAQRFANRWRRILWSQHFDHFDPVHNAPQPDEGCGADYSESECGELNPRRLYPLIDKVEADDDALDPLLESYQ